MINRPDPAQEETALRQLIINDELDRRPVRAPDLASESKALRALVHELANSPRTILKKLVEEALILSRAQSCGISLAETHEGQEIFRWHAIAGRLSGFVQGTMPRDFSPCGVVVERDQAQLMKVPIRLWTYIETLGIHLEEVLLIPFHQNGKPIGTLWAVVHDQERAFDAEDRRMLSTMAEFASAAVQCYRQTEELELTVSALKEERDLRERFVNSITHDMRTPLTVSKMSAQILARKFGADTGTQKIVNRVVDGIDRADRMIRDMLDADRLKAGYGIPIKHEICDLSEIVSKSIRTLSVAHGQRFVVIGDDSSVIGQFDADAISRVIENLCTNAVKYGSENTPITVTLAAQPDSVDLSVHNHGLHIPAGEVESVFEPYRRATGALGRDKKGWGIGLTLVKGIALAHGGSVTVHSEPDNGTTFSVRLPRGN